MNINILHIQNNDRRGVTLLLAVMFLTAGLSISLGIFYIVFVQLQINRAARESHKAFYAANTAKECAAYYRSYVGDSSNYGFWDIANPCNGDCAEPANIPVCRDTQVYKTSALPALVPGIDYNDPGDAPLPPGANVEGPDHEFKFSIRTDGTCADAVITTRRRKINHIPVTRVVTVVNGLSSCEDPSPVNRSFRECISSDLVDDCQ